MGRITKIDGIAKIDRFSKSTMQAAPDAAELFVRWPNRAQ
jgi:hypothetical protein